MNSTPFSIKDFTLIPIDSIKIGSRFRKDLGDIASLAGDIKENDLLHPIVINQNRELICGLRRIEAFKALSKTEIPAHIVKIDDIVKGELSENNQRKDFSWEEIIQIKKTVEPEIKKESEQRMRAGKPSAKSAEGTNESSNKPISKNYSQNQTCAKVAKYVNLHGKEISHATLAAAEKVYDAAQQEPATFGQIWTDLNSEKISPNTAYKKMQDEIVKAQPPTTKGTDDNGKGINSRRDNTECKDYQIKELEDVVSKTNNLRPANQITEEKDNKITQQKELDQHITSASKQNEARYVSHIPMPFEALQKDMTAMFRTSNGKVAKVFFKIYVDLGKLVGQIECCGITPQKDDTMISIGKGKLEVAGNRISAIDFIPPNSAVSKVNNTSDNDTHHHHQS